MSQPAHYFHYFQWQIILGEEEAEMVDGFEALSHLPSLIQEQYDNRLIVLSGDDCKKHEIQ
jgi:hypothetical protein